jgi:hypothetical protein
MILKASQIYVDALASILSLVELLHRGAIKEFVAGPREANHLETILMWSEPESGGEPLPGAKILCRTCGVPLQRQPEDDRCSRAHAKACIRAVRDTGQVYLNRNDAEMFGKLICSLL